MDTLLGQMQLSDTDYHRILYVSQKMNNMNGATTCPFYIECLSNKTLCSTDKRVLGLIITMLKSKHQCKISNRYIATYLGLSRGTVEKSIMRLIHKNFIVSNVPNLDGIRFLNYGRAFRPSKGKSDPTSEDSRTRFMSRAINSFKRRNKDQGDPYFSTQRNRDQVDPYFPTQVNKDQGDPYFSAKNGYSASKNNNNSDNSSNNRSNSKPKASNSHSNSVSSRQRNRDQGDPYFSTQRNRDQVDPYFSPRKRRALVKSLINGINHDKACIRRNNEMNKSASTNSSYSASDNRHDPYFPGSDNSESAIKGVRKGTPRKSALPKRANRREEYYETGHSFQSGGKFFSPRVASRNSLSSNVNSHRKTNVFSSMHLNDQDPSKMLESRNVFRGNGKLKEPAPKEPRQVGFQKEPRKSSFHTEPSNANNRSANDRSASNEFINNATSGLGKENSQSMEVSNTHKSDTRTNTSLDRNSAVSFSKPLNNVINANDTDNDQDRNTNQNTFDNSNSLNRRQSASDHQTLSSNGASTKQPKNSKQNEDAEREKEDIALEKESTNSRSNRNNDNDYRGKGYIGRNPDGTIDKSNGHDLHEHDVQHEEPTTVDGKMKALSKMFTKQYDSHMTFRSTQKCRKMIARYPIELIGKAFQAMLKYNVRSYGAMSYTERILQGWSRKGINTITDWENKYNHSVHTKRIHKLWRKWGYYGVPKYLDDNGIPAPEPLTPEVRRRRHQMAPTFYDKRGNRIIDLRPMSKKDAAKIKKIQLRIQDKKRDEDAKFMLKKSHEIDVEQARKRKEAHRKAFARLKRLNPHKAYLVKLRETNMKKYIWAVVADENKARAKARKKAEAQNAKRERYIQNEIPSQIWGLEIEWMRKYRRSHPGDAKLKGSNGLKTMNTIYRKHSSQYPKDRQIISKILHYDPDINAAHIVLHRIPMQLNADGTAFTRESVMKDINNARVHNWREIARKHRIRQEDEAIDRMIEKNGKSETVQKEVAKIRAKQAKAKASHRKKLASERKRIDRIPYSKIIIPAQPKAKNPATKDKGDKKTSGKGTNVLESIMKRQEILNKRNFRNRK